MRSNLVLRGGGDAPDEAADQAAKSAADKAAKKAAGVPAPSSTYYANCSEAKAAGAAHIYVGQPGYPPKFDRDKDGVACE